MNIDDCKNLKIAYIGGGSRQWARALMQDLAVEHELGGQVRLYDIDCAAAGDNAVIGNRLSAHPDAAGQWTYIACETIESALCGADFVIISVMPGTFDEMETDVHYPERYGIFQTVGDTVGAGGYLRAMRCVQPFRYFAAMIRTHCPKAWVINYTNPMSLCMGILYREFPDIRAFGCCHEVFGTQELLMRALYELRGIEAGDRREILLDVNGINHFTWATAASYRNLDLFPLYAEYADLCRERFERLADKDFITKESKAQEMVKFDLFKRYGAIACAGDRHLAEFTPAAWYMKDSGQIRDKWGFFRTSVAFRKQDLNERIERTMSFVRGDAVLAPEKSAEEGVEQIKAIVGLTRLVTNINLPNRGQSPDLPPDCIVETNGVFTRDSVAPVLSGRMPAAVNGLVARHAYNQTAFLDAAFLGSIEGVRNVLLNDPQCGGLDIDEVTDMFYVMAERTKKYTAGYWK